MTLPPPTVETVARFLASEHRREDPSIESIYWLRHPSEVRLIEVTRSVPAAGAVMPFRFTPDPPDVPKPSLVILMHPDDWNRRPSLSWPPGLNPGEFELIEPEEVNGNAG